MIDSNMLKFAQVNEIGHITSSAHLIDSHVAVTLEPQNLLPFTDPWHDLSEHLFWVSAILESDIDPSLKIIAHEISQGLYIERLVILIPKLVLELHENELVTDVVSDAIHAHFVNQISGSTILASSLSHRLQVLQTRGLPTKDSTHTINEFCRVSDQLAKSITMSYKRLGCMLQNELSKGRIEHFAINESPFELVYELLHHKFVPTEEFSRNNDFEGIRKWRASTKKAIYELITSLDVNEMIERGILNASILPQTKLEWREG